jgi:spore coat protein A, manganese oxidase
MSLSRRDLIKAGVFAGAATALPLRRFVSGQTSLANRIASSKLPKPFTIPFAVPGTLAPVYSDDSADYYNVDMKAGQAEIIPGYKSNVYTYNGSVPGPTIRATQGRGVVVRHNNKLPAMNDQYGYQPWTSVHLHGSPSLPQYDGYASDITLPGQSKDYYYDNNEDARMLWYHDHGVHHTAQNVYQGLFALYLLSDPSEQALGLPSGEFDVPLMLGDMMFDTAGNPLFTLEDESGMWGDVILVNGRPWPTMKVKRRKYRFRVLNCCISRSFNWRLDNGATFKVVGTDGGLVPNAITTKNVMMASAERYEVVIDFSKYQPGTRIRMLNNSPAKNKDYANTDKIMQFEVVRDSFSSANNNAPDVLDPDCPAMLLNESDAVTTRDFELHRQNGKWKINESTWEDVVNSNYQHVDAQPINGDVEIWQFRNESGGWFHPLHIHLVDFKILDRNGQPPRPWERGPKDVVYVGPEETVRVLMQFNGVGKYMMHCHNLVHEDHDMMTQFEVVDPYATGDDPLGTPAMPTEEMGPLW